MWAEPLRLTPVDALSEWEVRVTLGARTVKPPVLQINHIRHLTHKAGPRWWRSTVTCPESSFLAFETGTFSFIGPELSLGQLGCA